MKGCVAGVCGATVSGCRTVAWGYYHLALKTGFVELTSNCVGGVCGATVSGCRTVARGILPLSAEDGPSLVSRS